MPDGSAYHNDRLDRLESGMLDLNKGLSTLTADVNQMVRSQTTQQNQIVELQKADRDRRNAPYATLIAFGALLVSIGALALSPLDKQTAALAVEFENHRDRDGHPAMVERVEQLRSDVRRIDTRDYQDREFDDQFRTEVAEWRGEVRARLSALNEREEENEEDIADLMQQVSVSIRDRVEMTAWVDAIRERLGKIEANRFDATRGERVIEQLDRIDSELDKRAGWMIEQAQD